ncbi:helix-turn-helix transcriptional regulator [Pseudoalteromonas sp. R3]|uniref:helix-turn-helix domain-containing protein n=1 Tax=Pseudoalteromonas sp. R3 TaxID=1709477 RepID=UPI0006B6299D|nr:helix-turn-helix transcriptional regulator [Pseudoalteromonas sp. R3]AZZ98774.1 XRE family transcriptional regulator [Pseudoalteromonas sp. R3]
MSDAVSADVLLRVGRELRGMSQLDVAVLYGIGERTYRRYEAQGSPIKYVDLTGIVADVFHLQLDDLYQIAKEHQ